MSIYESHCQRSKQDKVVITRGGDITPSRGGNVTPFRGMNGTSSHKPKTTGPLSAEDHMFATCENTLSLTSRISSLKNCFAEKNILSVRKRAAFEERKRTYEIVLNMWYCCEYHIMTWQFSNKLAQFLWLFGNLFFFWHMVFKVFFRCKYFSRGGTL